MAMITFEDLPSTNTPINASNLNNNFSEILNLICPVGKIEVFFDNNNHSNYLGFTWERTLIGRVAVGIDSNDSSFDTIGETGGEKTHTLTTDEMPNHGHDVNYSGSAGTSVGVTAMGTKLGESGAIVKKTGGGQAHNNLQPYQVVAYWKRTA